MQKVGLWKENYEKGCREGHWKERKIAGKTKARGS